MKKKVFHRQHYHPLVKKDSGSNIIFQFCSSQYIGADKPQTNTVMTLSIPESVSEELRVFIEQQYRHATECGRADLLFTVPSDLLDDMVVNHILIAIKGPSARAEDDSVAQVVVHGHINQVSHDQFRFQLPMDAISISMRCLLEGNPWVHSKIV